MLCRKPYAKGKQLYPCGQCKPCRINKRRIWSHRIMLEAIDHYSSVFATLTYDAKNEPEGRTLDPRALQLFLKRLRKVYNGQKIRYFAVGEYGSKNGRPHYHIALFGFPKCLRGQTRQSKYPPGGPLYRPCCPHCETVRRIWGKGSIELATLEPASAAYIAGYTVKKMTAKDDERLNGRHPEFARMSLKPGIGAWFIDDVASTILENDLEEGLPDVPKSLRTGGKIQPLGRYLVRRLRVRIGRAPDTPDSVLDDIQAQLSPVWEAAEAMGTSLKTSDKAEIVKHILAEMFHGKQIRIDAMEQRNRKRETIE